MHKAALSSTAAKLTALVVVVAATLGALLLRRAVPPPASLVAAPAPTPSVGAPPASDDEEAQLLNGAKAALAAGDTDRAFSLLYEQATKFPRGPLAQEREVTHAQTLCRAGKPTDARAEAAAFVAQHPDSALSGRARGICAAP